MAQTVGRLKEGNLLLAGEINERMPAVTQGLVAHFPFDETEKGRAFRNLLNDSSWTLGTTGGGNGWSMHSSNVIVKETTPFEYQDKVVSVTVPDATSGYEGGWTNYSNPIDRTQRYRLSVWIRRENVGSGRTYFGCQGSTVCKLTTTDGTVDTNPYFSSKLVSDIPQIAGGWTLWVGHIHPHDYTGGTHSDSGIYTIDGTKISSVGDYKWAPTATTGGHRSYLYYSSSIGEQQFWYQPRMELSNGSESTLNDLLRGQNDFHQTSANAYMSLTEEGAGVEAGTTNVLPINIATGKEFLSSNNASYTVNSISTERAYVGKSSLMGRQIAEGGQRGFYTGWYSASPNVSYSGSCYVYTEVPITYSIYVAHNTPGGSVTTVTNSMTTIPHRWTRLFARNGVAPSDATHVRLIVSGSNVPVGTKVHFDAFQLEAKSYITSFVSDNRPANGSLRIDNIGGFTEYTVCGKFHPRTPLDATYNFTSSGSSMLRIEDALNVGGFFYRYYVSGTTSAPYMDNDGIYGTTHNHKYFTIAENKDLFYAIVKSGANVKMKVYQDGILLGEHVNTTANPIARLDSIVFGSTTIWNGCHKDIAIYNRLLSDEELKKNMTGGLSLGKEGSLKGQQAMENKEGWKLVWQGLASKSMFDVKSKDESVEYYGKDVVFNEMKITTPYFPYSVKASTTSTAVLQESFKYYMQWLDAQPDADSPRVKFHGLTGVQDVGFSTTNLIGYGYGNSWRQVTPIHNVSGDVYMYLGSLPSYINYTEWEGASGDAYQSNMDADAPRESGTYNLSPKEFNTIQVWVRMNPGTEDKKQMQSKKGELYLGQEIKEGEVL